MGKPIDKLKRELATIAEKTFSYCGKYPEKDFTFFINVSVDFLSKTLEQDIKRAWRRKVQGTSDRIQMDSNKSDPDHAPFFSMDKFPTIELGRNGMVEVNGEIRCLYIDDSSEEGMLIW